eukprot:8494418-Pyramimonas_sp.AAC.1
MFWRVLPRGRSELAWLGGSRTPPFYYETWTSSWSVVPSRDGGSSLRVSLPVFAAGGHGWAIWAGAPPQTQVRARARPADQRGLALGGRPQ